MWKIVVGALAGAATGYLIHLLASKPTPSSSTTPVASPPPGPRLVDWKCPPAATRLLLIGDSYAEGLAPQLTKLAEGCGTPCWADARRGSSATQWQNDSWLSPCIGTAQPTVALVSLGGNDFQRDPAVLEPAIDKIVKKLNLSGARVVWIAPLTLPFEDAAGVRAMWRARVGGDWFDSEQLDIKRAADGIHAYPDGYRYWAEQIWPWLNMRLRS